MPPKSGDHVAKSPLLKPAAAPKSPKCSPKLAPSQNALSSPQIRPLVIGSCRAVIPVASPSLGVVIGKEGKTLHRMERLFGVNLKVTKEGAAQGQEVLIVEGSDADSVAMCETYIHSLSHPESELLLPEDSVIPKRMSGRFIGARGSNKEMFEKKSGAVIEYDEDKTKVLIKGSQKAVAVAAALVRKFIADELLPKRKLGKEEQALVGEAEKVGIHLNTNQLDTFSKCLKETYILALKSFAAEDSQLSVVMARQGIKWTWRLCEVESAEFEAVPPALALELERVYIDESGSAVLCLPDASSYDVSLSAMTALSLGDSSRHQLHRGCSVPMSPSSRGASSASFPPSPSKDADIKAAALCNHLLQFGFQHREITICLRNGCPPEMDALICALTDLVACTWLSNTAAQNAKKSGGVAAPTSGGLVPMFVKQPQEQHQKMQQQASVGSERRPVVLDGSNIALRHGAIETFLICLIIVSCFCLWLLTAGSCVVCVFSCITFAYCAPLISCRFCKIFQLQGHFNCSQLVPWQRPRSLCCCTAKPS